jgi:hypothetical protein
MGKFTCTSRTNRVSNVLVRFEFIPLSFSPGAPPIVVLELVIPSGGVSSADFFPDHQYSVGQVLDAQLALMQAE